MADQKITELPENITPPVTDVLPIFDDPAFHMNRLRKILPKIIAVVTRNKRYMPEIVWSGGTSYVHDFFRALEWLFGRKYGIRPESSVNADLLEDGSIQIHRKFFTVESLLAHGEGLFRSYLKRKTDWQFNPLYARVILEIFGYKRSFVYGNGLINNLGYRFAIAFDNVQSGTPHTVANSTSLTYTCTTSGSDRMMATMVMASSARTINSVAYNSVNHTNVNRSTGGNQPVAGYYLVAPATGSNNVVVTIDASSFMYCGTTSYTGVDQSSPIDSNDTSSAITTSLTSTVTTTADNCWAVLGARGQTNGDTNASTNCTERSADNGYTQVYDSGGAITPAGSFSMTTTQTNQQTNHSMFAFKPSAASVVFIPRIIMY